jgi:hypothetical protein
LDCNKQFDNERSLCRSSKKPPYFSVYGALKVSRQNPGVPRWRYQKQANMWVLPPLSSYLLFYWNSPREEVMGIRTVKISRRNIQAISIFNQKRLEILYITRLIRKEGRMVVIQVLLIQMFLLVMIGAVTIIGVAGTTTSHRNRWQDRMINGNGTPQKTVNEGESPSFLKAIPQTSSPAPLNTEPSLKSNDPLESRVD